MTTFIVTALTLLLAYVFIYVPLRKKWRNTRVVNNRLIRLSPGCREVIWVPTSKGAVKKGSVVYDQGQLEINMSSDMEFRMTLSTGGYGPILLGFIGFHNISESKKFDLDPYRSHFVRIIYKHNYPHKEVTLLRILIN